MPWLKRLLLVLGVLALVFVVGGLLLPDRVEVERSIHIERPPAQVFAALNGFARFNEWSPWADYDTTARYDLSGPPTGVGARMEWSGEKGTGAQQILLVIPDELIAVDLDFGTDGTAEARYLLVPEDGGTRTIWQLRSEFGGSLTMRWFGLMFERMIGPDYERGLANLKRLLESEPPPATAAEARAFGADGFEIAGEPPAASEPTERRD
jgi:uncharacterized protein YndB with AHSA1/START domain